MIVLDASAAVEWLLGLPLADDVAERVSPEGETLHAPHLLAVEVAQVLRRYVSAGEIRPERAAEALADLADLDVAHHAHEPLLPTIWRLRANLTAYDAAYVALALALDAPLVTLDVESRRHPDTAQSLTRSAETAGRVRRARRHYGGAQDAPGSRARGQWPSFRWPSFRWPSFRWMLEGVC